METSCRRCLDDLDDSNIRMVDVEICQVDGIFTLFLGGGFEYVLFSTPPGEDFQFD